MDARSEGDARRNTTARDDIILHFTYMHDDRPATRRIFMDAARGRGKDTISIGTGSTRSY